MSELYQGPVVDAHHHLWDLTLGRHPWLSPTAGERGGPGYAVPIAIGRLVAA